MSPLYSTLTEKEVIESNPFPAIIGAGEDIEIRKKRYLSRHPISRGPFSLIDLVISTGYPDSQQMVFDPSPGYLSRQQIFNTIQALYQSHITPRDRQIADRLTALYRDTLAEGESILADSISQFTDFFLAHRELGLPKITLTPDCTLRARWIHGERDFTAIEFTGEAVVKLVAEIPRERGLTARYFSSEPVYNVLSAAKALGATFA